MLRAAGCISAVPRGIAGPIISMTQNHTNGERRGKCYGSKKSEIPVEVLTEICNCDEARLDEEYNKTWNCLMLPTDGSGEFVHRGSHPNYSRFIRWKIDDVCQGNITLDGIKAVAAIIRTFCEENMEAFVNIELNGKIDDFETYARTVEQSYS